MVAGGELGRGDIGLGLLKFFFFFKDSAFFSFFRRVWSSKKEVKLTVTTCSCLPRASFPLYCKSPIALDRLRLPLTRATPPKDETNPPAARMRAASVGAAGL